MTNTSSTMKGQPLGTRPAGHVGDLDSVQLFRHDGITHLSTARRHLSALFLHNTPKRFVNLCRAQHDMWARRPVTNAYPFIMKVEPTRLCNLACPGCPSGRADGNTAPMDLPFRLFKETVDDLAEYLYKVSLYGWGEPLVNNEIYDMIDHVRSRNIATAVSTNGMALTEANCKKLIAAGLENLIVSIDGVTQASYEKYRVGGILETVLENLRTLLRLRGNQKSRLPVVELQFLVTEKTQAEVGAVGKLARDLGVDKLTLKSFYDEGRGCFESGAAQHEVSSDPRTDTRVIRRKKPCYWLWSATELLYDGTILPCCFKSSKPSMGNANDTSVRAIWNNEIYQANRLLFSRNPGPIPTKALKECLNCSLFL